MTTHRRGYGPYLWLKVYFQKLFFKKTTKKTLILLELTK